MGACCSHAAGKPPADQLAAVHVDIDISNDGPSGRFPRPVLSLEAKPPLELRVRVELMALREALAADGDIPGLADASPSSSAVETAFGAYKVALQMS